MYRQRRAVERIVTLEVMRLERRRTIERRDIAHARRRSAVAAPTRPCAPSSSAPELTLNWSDERAMATGS